MALVRTFDEDPLYRLIAGEEPPEHARVSLIVPHLPNLGMAFVHKCTNNYMPRYFFDISHENDLHEDRIGEELPDRHAAWNEATRHAGEALKDIDGRLKPGQTWRLEVRDEFANRLYLLEVRSLWRRLITMMWRLNGALAAQARKQ